MIRIRINFAKKELVIMKIRGFIKRILTGLYNSIRRFPVTMAFSAVVVIMGIVLLHWDNINENTRTFLMRLLMILAMGIPLSLSIRIFFERFRIIKSYFKALTYLAGAVFLILYYFILLKEINLVSGIRYAAVNIALYLCFIFIPYLFKIRNFEMYVIKLFTRFIITFVYSGVMYGGICAIIFAINKLLGVPISENIYLDTLFIVAGIFGICFFLGGIPAIDEELDENNYPVILKILVLYIVIPILSAYTMILYIYFVKILITRQWPNGLVSNLVLWYSMIGIAVLFFISPLKDLVKWVKYFIFWFSKIILPLIAMMFVSMGIRLSAYGITENRYYVLIMGAWIAAIMIYISLKKNTRNIILPVSLAIIAVLSVMGPWSSFSVSEFSQNKRLESILTKYDMIENNTIIKTKTELPDADKTEITQIISYFENSKRLKDVKYLPENYNNSNFEDEFGFSPTYNYPNLEEPYFYKYLETLDTPIDIKGFDYFFDMKGIRNNNTQSNKGLTVKFDIPDLDLVINNEDKEIYKRNLRDYADSIYKKYNAADPNTLTAADMTFTDQNDKVSVKFLINNISGNNQSGKLIIDTFDFYLFVKIK
jgi:hypothetical protein